MYTSLSNQHGNDQNITNDGSNLVYPEFTPMSNENINKPGSTASTNTYLNNMRKEMLSMVNNNTTTINTSNDISINMGDSNSSININKSGYSTISNATSTDNLNNRLLEKNENSNSIDNIMLDDEDISPESIKHNKMISSLAYLTFIGAAIVLINEKKNVYTQFHAYQSFYISMGVIGFQLLLTWSNILSTILWLTYILVIVFMIYKIYKAYNGRKSFYRLPIIGILSENRAYLRVKEYSQYLKQQNDLLKIEIQQHKLRLINHARNNNNRGNNRGIITSNVNISNDNSGHSRINSNSSSMLMSDSESMLNNSDSNSSIYSETNQNEVGINEE